jgi:hypothetical protein
MFKILGFAFKFLRMVIGGLLDFSIKAFKMLSYATMVVVLASVYRGWMARKQTPPNMQYRSYTLPDNAPVDMDMPVP